MTTSTLAVRLSVLVLGAAVTACNGGASTAFSGADDAATDAKHDAGAHHDDASHPSDASHPHDVTVSPDAHPPGDAGHDVARPPVDGGEDTSVGNPDAPGSDGGACNTSAPPKSAPCTITDALGVFVAPSVYGGSDATGNGSMAMPFGSIGRALSTAGLKRVYVCGATYDEQVTVTASASVYGGLACPLSLGGDAGVGGIPAWSYSGQPAIVAPSTAGYALAVQVVTGATFEDLTFTATAAPPDAGASSVAVLLNESSNIVLTRVRANASGASAGVSQPAPSHSNWCIATGQAGAVTAGAGGGLGGVCLCDVVETDQSNGGNGGNEEEQGSSGTCIPAAAGTEGLGGPGNATVTCAGAGVAGANGAALAGGVAGTAGTLNGNGWAVVPGGDGVTGDPGQGGGGGGGTSALGGAGGGAGGCGGSGGAGGTGGGASIAIAIVNSTVTCNQVGLQTGAAGAGGAGGVGEPGQAGGPAGFEAAGCSGGAGGQGAGGGGGGGAAGGPSVGIAIAGASSTLLVDGVLITPPVATLTSPSSFSPGGGGAAGTGGVGGAAASGGVAGASGGSGVPGVSAAVAKF